MRILRDSNNKIIGERLHDILEGSEGLHGTHEMEKDSGVGKMDKVFNKMLAVLAMTLITVIAAVMIMMKVV